MDALGDNRIYLFFASPVCGGRPTRDFERRVEDQISKFQMCGATDNRAAQMSPTLTLPPRTGEGIRESLTLEAQPH